MSEKDKFDTNAVIAPTRNPVSPPNATPEIITIAATGLNCGSIKNAVRPATPIAHNALIITNSLALGLGFQAPNPKRIIVSNIIKASL